MSETVTVKRQFAVILEDAFEVPMPTREELAEFNWDLEAWARERIDSLYVLADDDSSPVRLCWEDQHKADVDSIDDEIIVESNGLSIDEQIKAQVEWISEHGSDLAGYIERYGSKDDDEHYGDGGEAIFAADFAELQRLIGLRGN